MIEQDEERDVYVVVTGLFEQFFTIARDVSPTLGKSVYSGMGSTTRTEG